MTFEITQLIRFLQEKDKEGKEYIELNYVAKSLELETVNFAAKFGKVLPINIEVGPDHSNDELRYKLY